MFFVLGFVIAFVTDAKERTPRAYAASRLSRLWSVALPALAATLAMDAIGKWLAPQAYADVLNNPLGPLASALFVNEFWTAQWHVGSNIPFWSLSYEAAYYLLFGIFVFAPMRWLWLAAAAALIGPKILLLAPAWIAGVIAYRAAQRNPLRHRRRSAGRSGRRPGLWSVGLQGRESVHDLAVAEMAR